MTPDDPVEWITLHIEEGQHLYVDGEEMRSYEEVVAWEARVKRWTEKAISGVQARSRDVATVRTLGRRPLVRMPVDHPYWTQPRVFVNHSTSSSECVESNPLSRLNDRIESLKENASNWRANPPVPPKPSMAATGGAPVIAGDTNSIGRPTLEPEIKAAYEEIRDAGDINFDAPKIKLYDPIREKVRGYKGDPSLKRGLGIEAIRKVISPLFEADKNARPTSP